MNEKRMLGNYEVTQSIYVGDKEVVLAVDKKGTVSLFSLLLRLPQSAVSSVGN